jgi:hypothetical protein
LSEHVTAAEACALLNMTMDELRTLMGGPDEPDAVHHMTIRHLLAVKVTGALLPFVLRDVAVRTGVSAARDAQLGGQRLLVIASPDGQEPKALWREADAGFRVTRPFIAVPADDWLSGLTELVHEHRRAADRPN